ncbi:hypothetical protein Bca4012_025929 [Brassica carinata]|uniref:Uncharacterized protein n=1 Tax=Brassica carinata TaxID=52824 RepID=A0A8X7VI72_BRACI|nr:hypothetical protein Bca52824_023017 [Brassica carinata]
MHRQQARIAKVYWKSRQPLVLGPRKSRLSLFTRKQQKLLNKAREMSGVPDVSALLKGKLQLLSKKSVPEGASAGSGGADTSQQNIPSLVDENVDAEPLAPNPKKKRKKDSSKKAASSGEPALVKEFAPSKGSSEGSKAREKTKRKGSRGDPAIDHGDETGAFVGVDPDNEAPKERLKKRSRKKPAAKDQQSSDLGAIPADAIESTRLKAKLEERGSSPGVLCESGPKEAGHTEVSRVPSGEIRGNVSPPKPSKVCAELTRQIRGGPRVMQPIGDLFFRDEYVAAAQAGRRADGSMNVLVERYDSTLRQTMVDLGASEKLARANLNAIERIKAEQKNAAGKLLRRRRSYGLTRLLRGRRRNCSERRTPSWRS